MAAGDRFKSWIESLADDWKDRLKGWFADWVEGGLIHLLEAREPEIIGLSQEAVQKLIDNPNISPELKAMLQKSLQTGDIFTTMLGWLVCIVGLIPAILGAGAPIGQLIQYTANQVLTPQRLTPDILISLWRRFPGKYENLARDLEELGWYTDRVEALKDYTLFYPGPSDLVRFQAREVFEPDMISRYGLDDEFGNIDLEPFRKAGMTDEITLYYWRAHWEHASWNQVVEMLHRGQLTDEEVRDWFRLVEIPPFWRDKLIATSWNVPTRVDVRRFYDLKTIDETRLREIYTAMGYHGKDLDDYVLWTKIYVELPDLIARWKNGWITLDDARVRLVELGMTRANADELIQTKVKVEEPEAVTEAKNLTKTEIYKGVKQEVITFDQGVELLMDLDYSRDQAEYLLDINVETLTGSPGTFEEFKRLTERHVKAGSMETTPVPEEIKAAADELVKIKLEVESLERAEKEERAKLTSEEEVPDTASARLREIQVALNRARAELQRQQLDYNALITRWKYGAG